MTTRDANLAVVYNRLYQHAIALRSKMEERREALQQEEAANVNSSRTAMSWISAEMMRERSSGAYDNYGEMLYAEGLEVMARRRDRVRQLAAWSVHAVAVMVSCSKAEEAPEEKR